MGGRIPEGEDVDEIADDDEGGDDDDDDEEENFDGSGLSPMLTTLNSFNTNGLARPTPKEEPTTSLPSTTLPSTETDDDIYSSQFTTISPNVHHRSRSFRLAPTAKLFYFVFIPSLWLLHLK